MAMAAGDGGLDSAARRINRALGWVEEVEGEVREVGACRNRAGAARGGRHERRRWLCSSSAQRKREEERGGRKRTRLYGDKEGRASTAGEVRRQPTRGIAGAVAGRRHGRAYGVTGEHSNRVELV